MASPQAMAWTVAAVEALPYNEWMRYEVIDGELYVSTAPRYEHQRICSILDAAFEGWSAQTRLGRVIPGPGLVFTETDGVIPDLVWVSHERLARLLDTAGHLRGAPELVVEVLSPGAANAERDRAIKLRLYGRYGVDEYWIVDWPARRVEIYRRARTRLRLVATLGPDDTLASSLLPGLALPVARLFEW